MADAMAEFKALPADKVAEFGGPGSGPHPGDGGTKDVSLPNNPKKLNIDTAAAFLKQKGYTLGKGASVVHDGTVSTQYELTLPSGEKKTASVGAIRDILYAKPAQHAETFSESPILRTDFEEVDPRVAEAVRQKKYRKVSAEVYDSPPEGIPHQRVVEELRARGHDPNRVKLAAKTYAEKRMAELKAEGQQVDKRGFQALIEEGMRVPLGKMLRRVVLLGGEIPQLKTLADIPAPQGAGAHTTIPGVEAFAIGTHRLKSYDPDDLTDMKRNFAAFSTGPKALVRVPVVLGHEENQEYLDRSDLPAAGWVARAYREEKPVRCLKFSEVRPAKTRGSFHVFAEVESYLDPLNAIGALAGSEPAMSHEEMIQFLTQAGWKPEVLAKMDDEMLAECVRSEQEEGEGDATPNADGAPASSPFADMTPPIADTPMADAQAPLATPLHTAIAPINKPAIAGEQPMAAAPAATPPHPSAAMPPPKQITTTHKYAEMVQDVAKAVREQIQAEIAPIRHNVQKFAEDSKRARAENVIAVYKDRIQPWEMDEGGKLPTLLNDLLRSDDKTVVHKFKEGKVEKQLTEFDLLVERIKNRKPINFSEKMPTSGELIKDSTDEEEVEKVKRRIEQPKFQNALRAAGKTTKDFVAKFSELRKKNPNLTAEAYGVTDN